MKYGTIKSFDSSTGTGTISTGNGEGDLAFRKADLRQDAQERQQNDRYSYEMKNGEGGKRSVSKRQREQAQDNNQQTQACKQWG